MSDSNQITNPILRIRNATENDLAVVCEIDNQAFSPYGTAELPAIFRERLKVFPQGFIVAENQGKVIGYGTSEKWMTVRQPAMNEDPVQTHSSGGRIYCITAMAVSKDLRGQGVGSALLARLKDIAREQNCTQIILETTHAQEFYLRNGFYLFGERRQMGARLLIFVTDLIAPGQEVP